MGLSLPRTIANWREVGSAVVGGSSGGFGGATGLGAGTFGAGAFGAGAFGAGAFGAGAFGAGAFGAGAIDAGALSSVRLAFLSAFCALSKAAIASALMLAAGSQLSSDRVKPAQCTRYWTSWPRFLLPCRPPTTKHPSPANSASSASVATSGTAHDQGPSLRMVVLILQYHCAGSGNADAGKSLHLLHRSHCAHVSISSESVAIARLPRVVGRVRAPRVCLGRGDKRGEGYRQTVSPPHKRVRPLGPPPTRPLTLSPCRF